MPDDRLFHRRAGHSAKVTALSDLEFRVWWTYVLAADDYGVMRCSPVVVQAANDALASKPARMILKALEALIKIGLLVDFTHQHNRYVCQLDWQDYQRVRHPRGTTEPSPPAAILQKCSRETAALFQQHSGKVSEEFPSRGGSRETANGKRLTANGSEKEPPLDRWFAELHAAYPEKARSAGHLTEHAFTEVFQRDTRDPALVWADLQAALANAKSSEQWAVKKMVPKLEKWLREGLYTQRHDPVVGEDAPGREPWHWKFCPHVPKCGDSRECSELKQAEAAAS